MKMKKLLSIGALGLVIAMSTSFGASAATKPSNEQIKTDMEALFKANQSPLTYNVTKDTKVGSIINLTKFKAVIEKYEAGANCDKLNDALELIKDDDTLISIAGKIIVKFSQADLEELITEVRSVADRLKEIENGTNRIAFQEDMKTVVNDSTVKLVFGKNKDGKSTVAVMQNNQIILQLNSGNAYTVNDFLNNHDSDNLTDYAQTIADFLK